MLPALVVHFEKGICLFKGSKRRNYYTKLDDQIVKLPFISSAYHSLAAPKRVKAYERCIQNFPELDCLRSFFDDDYFWN